MSQLDPYSSERRSWWEKLFGLRGPRRSEEILQQLPPDSLFAGVGAAADGGAAGPLHASPLSVADVPERLKSQIREAAVVEAFNRLQASLRLLLYATTPDTEPPSPERCQQILNVWRFELEHQVHLTPDTYCGAVQRYQPGMDLAYTIEGRCAPGDLLRIRVPCWRMYDQIVVRGEAVRIESADEDAEQTRGTGTAASGSVR